jgi:hypothetical protein
MNGVWAEMIHILREYRRTESLWLKVGDLCACVLFYSAMVGIIISNVKGSLVILLAVEFLRNFVNEANQHRIQCLWRWAWPFAICWVGMIFYIFFIAMRVHMATSASKQIAGVRRETGD